MMCNRVAAAVVMSLSLAGLTGCATGDAAAAPVPVTAPASAAPSRPAMTLKQAGATYLQLSAASNAARDAWMRAGRPTTAGLAGHKKVAARAAAATATFSKGLRGHRWPEKARPYVEALDRHLKDRAAAYRRVAAARTVDEYVAAAVRVPVTTSLTGDVRTALGLPESAVVKGVVPQR